MSTKSWRRRLADTTSSASITALAVQPGGQLLVGGSFTDFDEVASIGLIRLNGDSAPGFSSISSSPGQGMCLSGTVSSGRTVVLEASIDLRHWVPVRTNAFTTGTFESEESAIYAVTRQFYRAFRQ